MNYLAGGGGLMNSCKVAFKTTPVNVKIRFEVREYPKPLIIAMRPPKNCFQAHQDRLITGNMRAICGGIGIVKPGGYTVYTSL